MVISVYDFEAGRMLELIFISVYYMCVYVCVCVCECVRARERVMHAG